MRERSERQSGVEEGICELGLRGGSLVPDTAHLLWLCSLQWLVRLCRASRASSSTAGNSSAAQHALRSLSAVTLLLATLLTLLYRCAALALLLSKDSGLMDFKLPLID